MKTIILSLSMICFTAFTAHAEESAKVCGYIKGKITAGVDREYDMNDFIQFTLSNEGKKGVSVRVRNVHAAQIATYAKENNKKVCVSQLGILKTGKYQNYFVVSVE